MFNTISVEEKPRLIEWGTLPRPKTTQACDFKEVEKLRKARKTAKGPGPITWTVTDLAKAGCLLNCPPLTTAFEDEQEMRRVYTLIYDVFRYKNVLTEALRGINFLGTYPKLSTNIAVVWLLFYDLYHRSFTKRETSVAPIAAQLFDTYGFSYAENALWSQKIKLSASIARLRIKNNALSLSEMLPPHLKDEKVTELAQNNPVTCWINTHKSRDADQLCRDIQRRFGLRLVSDIQKLNPHTFKWDVHCPQTIVFHASMRPILAKSNFVKEHNVIVQDKSFCLGPATFKKLLSDLELTGTVIQTHINSPRTTAYLATLLAQNEKIIKLLAFSAGKRKKEYESYFKELGMSNIRLFSDRLIDTPPDAHYMEDVVAVFATPPNSYSAVVDPIDLVCSRGGDLSMLEILTETGDSKEARERVTQILEEQQKTLRFAMSRPQIQFVLYETHSELEEENFCMVNMTLKEINKNAKLQHASLQGKVCSPQSNETMVEEINNNTEQIGDADFRPTQNDQEILETLIVPDTDLFETLELPTLCDNSTCKTAGCTGCYLALIQRKQIIRLDDKYMIQMAENRGLFGRNSNSFSVKSKASRVIRTKVEQNNSKNHSSSKRLKEVEIGRIAAPTQTFLRHTKSISELHCCPKDIRGSETERSIYKSWWKEASRHINSLRKNLVRKKIIPYTTSFPNISSVKAVVGSARKSLVSLDELIKEKNMASKIPIFPRLKLKRSRVFEKNRVPVAVTHLSFPAAVKKKDEKDEEVTDDIFECSTQTRDKFVRRPMKVYQLSESEDALVRKEPDPIVAKLIVQASEKFTQSPAIERFSLARLQSAESDKNIPDCEVIKPGQEKNDVSVLAQPERCSRPILSRLSSAHIRQLVCPFYRQLDSLPNRGGPPVTEVFKSDLRSTSNRIGDILSKSKADCAQTDPKMLKKTLVFPEVDSPVVQYEIPSVIKKQKRVARLSTPSHSSRAKIKSKSRYVLEGSQYNPTRNESAPCEHCKIKNLKHVHKGVDYDELQNFLDNID